MNAATGKFDIRDEDGLRLFGLSRIPKCAACPRFDGLSQAHAGGSSSANQLPPVPSWCIYQFCAPLVARLSRPEVVSVID
jgi:hypothetical protein